MRKLEQSLHITQDGYALYELGENSITLSPNDMESIINSANQYARDIERIDADSNTDSFNHLGSACKNGICL
jgi:hypothetical protein